VEAGNFPDPPYITRAAFFATTDPTAQAEETFEWIIQNYITPAGFSPTRVYPPYPDGSGTVPIRDAINAGQLMAVYIGHSTPAAWWAPAFTQSDIRSLSNTGLYPFVFAFCCNTANYINAECFGETWIREANKGAAAYLSASDYIFYGTVETWESSRRLCRYFFESFFKDGIYRIGPAWEAALWRFWADYGPNHEYTRNFFEEFIILGDPSLHLPIAGYNIVPRDDLGTLCSGITQIQYVIDVTQHAGFSQPVTLSASGYPGGWNANFSVNDQVPPFTTTLTVSNVSGSPGMYTINLSGSSSAGLLRRASVRLHLATALPGAVTLSSPANGATGVSRSPILAWQPATQAAKYEVQVATDYSFNNVVYSAVTDATSHLVNMYLQPSTRYYWRVRGRNGCGIGSFSMPWLFTTLVLPNYFTEQFDLSSPFDLDNWTMTFVPDGSSDFYSMCGEPATQLPTNPAGGTSLTTGEDSFAVVVPSQSVRLYGRSYIYFYVNANGNLTFDAGDSTALETLAAHFSQPRISMLFHDLSPQLGTVSYKNLSDRCAVTYLNVPERGTSNYNTFQVELFYNGRLRLTWLNCATSTAIVGLSRGLGIPSDFVEDDLSSHPCVTPGDMNCDGLINAFDIDPFTLALTDPAGYQAAYPNCNIMNGDVNGDGAVNAFDIDPFVDLLTAN